MFRKHIRPNSELFVKSFAIQFQEESRVSPDLLRSSSIQPKYIQWQPEFHLFGSKKKLNVIDILTQWL